MRRSLFAVLLAAWTGLAVAATPGETVDAFHKALRQGRGDGALQYLAPDVTVFEQGFAESSRDDYAKHQLADAADFARKTQRRVLRRYSGQGGDSAWVQSQTFTTGEFDKRKLELFGTETMLLRQERGEWKIVHIHWSAHPRGEDEPAPAP